MRKNITILFSSGVNYSQPKKNKCSNNCSNDHYDRQYQTNNINISFTVVGTTAIREADFINVVHDQTKEGHEYENLNDHKKIILVCHTPDYSSLLFTHPEIVHINSI